MIQSVVVFCGSSDRVRAEYLTGAHQMGALLARQGLRVVYGAGRTGLMGALAEGALQAGGEVVGVIPEFFNTPRLAFDNLTRLEVVENMHQRKARFAELGDAFIALPGGLGTFEELFEILTWAQVGLHHKPIGLLNLRGYYRPVLDLIQHAFSEGMLYAEHRDLLVWHDQPELLLQLLLAYQPPAGLERWTTRDD